MTPLTYVIGAIVLSVIVVALMYVSPDRSVRCPRCGAVMSRGGEGAWNLDTYIHVVPEVQEFLCPQCGYAWKSSP
jgi:predicted RNA-binding Zn-ribbon protein involved in translation (DUF1610 family)